jgi:HEAT repeats
MLTAQIIATGFVYRSDQSVLALVRAVEEAGFFPVPAGPAIASLNSFAAAFWGGLFYTLSIGVGLTLLTWGGIRLWQLLFRQSRPFLISLIVGWVGLIGIINARAIAVFPSMFCLLVPLVTAVAGMQTMPPVDNFRKPIWMVPVLTLIALAALWATQMKADLFVSIRDNILLSNPVGRQVNDFYYRYTLYAAEAFKSFDQKTLRSCNLNAVADRPMARQLEKLLARRDVLPLPQIKHPDIRLVSSGKQLQLISDGGRRIEVTAEELSAHPDQVLRSFSGATDRFAPFRRMTLVGLLLGFPILMFVTAYGALHLFARRLTDPSRATLTVSGICMVIGILLFLPMLNAHPMPITPQNINAALAADQWSHRVAALRYIAKHNLEIEAYPGYRRLLTSPLVVERYWLARAMAKSRAYETYTRLLPLIHDPHPNVICQAFYALGALGRRTAIDPIKHRLVELDHWYAQWYAYRALRTLGWQQTQSN